MSLTLNRLDNSTSSQVIRLLQRHGPLSIQDLRKKLALGDTAVRQQLKGLMARGLVHSRTIERHGIGRPRHLYELTERARELFACHADELALNLYEELLADQGPDVVRRLLGRVSRRMAGELAYEVKGKGLVERVRSFSQTLDHKGILSEVSHNEDIIVLYEYNCPYHELAAAHRDICHMEQSMLSQVFEAEVKLTTCMMDGNSGCAFTVRPIVYE